MSVGIEQQTAYPRLDRGSIVHRPLDPRPARTPSVLGFPSTSIGGKCSNNLIAEK